MEIGRKIYYEKSNGVVIWDKGQMTGDVRIPTFEEDAQIIPMLNILASKGQLGVKELNYDELETIFAECKGYYIDVESNNIIFL